MTIMRAPGEFRSTTPLADRGAEAAQAPALAPLDTARLARAKRAYTTRNVNLGNASCLLTGSYAPRAGDVLLARVDKLSQHQKLELTSGRRAELHPGNEILVCYGNRYAPDQFEAEVAEDLAPCNLVAGGGIAAQVISRHAKMRPATRIEPIGVLADANGRALNLGDFAVRARRVGSTRPRVTAVVGTSMNAGKTTTVSNLALGLARQGLRVGAAKVTGTGSGGDIWQMLDAGCHTALDFTHCGIASTYKLPAERCEAVMETLIGCLCEAGADVILIEVADGILQEETRTLIRSATFERLVDNVIFAAGDALGAAAGVSWLRAQGRRVVGVSGLLTAAPLAMRECAGLIDLPLLAMDTLNSGVWSPESTSVPVATAAVAAASIRAA